MREKLRTFMNGSHGELVVQELSKLHHHEGISRMKIGNVRVDNSGDNTRRRQRSTRYGVYTGTANTWKTKDNIFVQLLSGRKR